MAFSRMAFNPEGGLNDTEYYETTPASEANARAQVQSVSDQLKAYLNDTLLSELENAQAGQSGAEKIGSAEIEYVSGETVRAQIADVKRQIDDVSAGSVTDGAVTTAKLAGGAVTKPKLHSSALNWTQVLDSGVLSTSGGLIIASQTGKSEMMIQLRNEENTMTSGFIIAPLNESGMLIPTAVRVMGCNPYDCSVDYRTFTMTSATQIVYGLSRAESVNGVTNLKRAFVFVR